MAFSTLLNDAQEQARPVVAIVGRSNVGKSTLFNRLVKQRAALVHDTPGVTRDVRVGLARLCGLCFTVLDTGGLESTTHRVSNHSLARKMLDMTKQALDSADACVFVIDARSGVLSPDYAIAQHIRRYNKPVVLVANKAEGNARAVLRYPGVWDATELGLGPAVAVSAEHGEGLTDLADALVQHSALFHTTSEIETDTVPTEPPKEHKPKPLKIAVVGRPNAGKSTLINRIIDDHRLLTGAEAGITRDTIAINAVWAGTHVRLFDTAGMRKRAKVNSVLEKLSVSDSVRAIRFAEVIIVLSESINPLETQDLRLCDLIEQEGRAIVIALSKSDLIAVAEQKAFVPKWHSACERLLPQMRGVPLVMVSGQNNQGLDALHNAVLEAYRIWNTRIATAILNDWLQATTLAHPPPAPQGKRIKMYYMTQFSVRPPSFAVMCSGVRGVPTDYKRYLVNKLRSDFSLTGTPVRLSFRARGARVGARDKRHR